MELFKYNSIIHKYNMANPIDPTISSIENTYVNLSGLQAFYDELPSKLVIDSARSAGSAAIANDAQNLGGVPATDVINSAHSGQSAYDWVTDNSAKLADVSALKDIKTFSSVSYGEDILGTLFTKTVSADSSASNLNLLENGNIKISGYNNNILFSAKDTTYSSLNEINSDEYNALTGVSGTTSYFTNGSAKSAINATSSTSAEYASSAEYAPASSHDHDYKINVDDSTVYLSGDVGLKVSGDNVKYFIDGQDIYISAKDTTYTTANFITATHLPNIQTASGYAQNWSDNSGTVIDSANSGAAASAWITAHQNDYLVTSYSSDSNATFAGTANSANYATDAGSASSAETLTNTAIEVASATSAVYSLSAGSASSAEKLTNTAIKVNSSISADYATDAGSATSAENLTNTAIKVNSAISADYSTKAGSATSAEILTNTAIKVNSAISADYSTNAGSATSASVLTNTAIKVASATSADYAISAGSAVRLEKKRTIAASGDATWSVQFNGAGNVTGNLQINNTPWSSVSSHASTVDSAITNKFTTPKAVYDFVIETVTEKASFIGPETALDDFQKPYDKTAIYLVGPVGTGTDRYNEYVITGNAGTTADFLLIGDTSTDLSDYQKIADFESWTAARFDGTSAKWAKSATSASKAETLTNTAIKVNSSISADYATNAGTADYAVSAGSAPFIEHDHGYKISANTTGFYVSGNIQLSAGTNVGLVSAGPNSIGITAKDTTYSTLKTINSNEFNALTGVSGVKDIKNYSTISAASGSTSKGSFAPSNSASTFTLIAGNNIDFVSGANSLTISSKTYTVNDKTIKITTGANPATGQFTTNTAADKTITLGSMALAQTSSYSETGHNHNMTALNGTANFFSGTTAAPSALSALTSKSAISAGSAAKAASATSALTAGQAEAATWTVAADSDLDRPLGMANASHSAEWTTGGQWKHDTAYDKVLTFNASSNTLKSPNISATNITATTFSGNLSGSATSALTSKSALSAGSAKNAATASYATSAGAAPVAPHDHDYKLSGNGTAVNVSAGINFKPSGSNVKFYVSGNDIYISAKNDNSTAYIPSGFKVSAINGTTTGEYFLSALKLNAGSNIGFTSASNSQITITAKDTTYTSLNSINSTEYNALTSTSANKRDPNAHQLSSHTNFSTYFDSTSAKSALTSKSALSAGSAKNAEYATSAGAAPVASHTIASHSDAGNIFSGNWARSAVSAKYGDWHEKSDNREYRVAFSLDKEFDYDTAFNFNPNSNVLTVPTVSGNVSGTSYYANHLKSLNIIVPDGSAHYYKLCTVAHNNSSQGFGTPVTFIFCTRDSSDTNGQGILVVKNQTYTVATSEDGIYLLTNKALNAEFKTKHTTSAIDVYVKLGSWSDLSYSLLNKLSYINYYHYGTEITQADYDAVPTTVPVYRYSLTNHNHAYQLSAGTSPFNISAGIQLSAGSNISITSAGTKSIGISARDTTYSTANFITANKTVGVSSNNTNVGTVNLSAISFSAGSNVTFGTAANNIITITAKDTTYSTSNFITATHLSNIQTASGYAADWNTNKTNLTNSAKSGWSAYSAVTAHSAEWATNTDTKVSQTVTSDNVFYPILTKDSNGTTTVTAGARFADVVTVNPSTKMVRANKFGITSSATMEFNSTTNSVDFIFN